MKKQIVIQFYNSFTGEEYVRLNGAYNRMKAVNNWYSRWCRKMIPIQANVYGTDKRFIKIKFNIYTL